MNQCSCNFRHLGIAVTFFITKSIRFIGLRVNPVNNDVEMPEITFCRCMFNFKIDFVLAYYCSLYNYASFVNERSSQVINFYSKHIVLYFEQYLSC